MTHKTKSLQEIVGFFVGNSKIVDRCYGLLFHKL